MKLLSQPLSKTWMLFITIFLFILSGCNKINWTDTFNGSKKIYVNNIDQLYAAINNTANSGSTIVMAPGTYFLDAKYPNGGRLDMGYNMSLIGRSGHPEAVIINVTGLPASSLAVPPSLTFPGSFRTGAVRMGNGENSIEWMTLQNDTSQNIRSIIQADIVATPLTNIIIAHTVVKGGTVGINLQNRDVPANGRIIDADIEDNEISGNIIPPLGAGIQIQNSMNVTGATIRATLKRNYIHGNPQGMVVFNASSIKNKIEIKSYSDRIEDNGLGLSLGGGYSERLEFPTQENSTLFDAYGTTLRNNSGIPQLPAALNAFTGGVFAVGANVPQTVVPGSVNNNNLQINFWGCSIENNIGPFNIYAYGAYSNYPSTTPAGSNNTTTIHLDGLSQNVSANGISSFPNEPAGTNTVSIIR